MSTQAATRQAPEFGWPTAYLLGALGGCAVAFVHDTLAPRQAWLERCPIYLALLEPNPVDVSFTTARAGATARP